jgi:adenylosuccinate synthase
VNHVIVADLGYGDAGKGTVVDWLCSQGKVKTVVRFNGGAQAGHNVVTADGRHHTFAQFGSGTFTPGVRTYLSRFSLVDPLALASEAAHLASAGVTDALDRLVVDVDALLTTPYHQAANRARELARGAGRHGSCGMGIGETASYALAWPDDAPRAGDCLAPRVLARKLGTLRDWLTSEFGELPAPPQAAVLAAYRAFADRVALADGACLRSLLNSWPAVFEGAQGVLLDQWRGFHPYTTWSSTTFANAEALLAEAGQGALRLGVVRCYQVRHGPGPFPTEDRSLDLPEPHNRGNDWQGAFRTGHLDAVALRYAAEVAGGADAIALTHLDVARTQPNLRVCRSYLVGGEPVTRIEPGPPRDLDYQQRLTSTMFQARPVYTEPAASWAEVVEEAAGAPVTLLSRGPTAAAKAARRLAGSSLVSA